MPRTTRKQIEKGQLKATDTIWIGIKATEANLQRLGAFLLFADYHVEEAPPEPTLLPWEDPNDPRYKEERPLQIDYELVKRNITTVMKELVTTKGEAFKPTILAVIRDHGGEKLSTVPQDKLVELYAALDQLKEETQ